MSEQNYHTSMGFYKIGSGTLMKANLLALLMHIQVSEARNLIRKLTIIAIMYLERFSNDCRKTKTKAIAPTNHNRSRQRDEPITIPSNYL